MRACSLLSLVLAIIITKFAPGLIVVFTSSFGHAWITTKSHTKQKEKKKERKNIGLSLRDAASLQVCDNWIVLIELDKCV